MQRELALGSPRRTVAQASQGRVRLEERSGGLQKPGPLGRDQSHEEAPRPGRPGACVLRGEGCNKARIRTSELSLESGRGMESTTVQRTCAMELGAWHMSGGVWLSPGGFAELCDLYNRTQPSQLGQDCRKMMNASHNLEDAFRYAYEMLPRAP